MSDADVPIRRPAHRSEGDASCRFDQSSRIILWDLDGTIVDTSGDLAAAINRMLADFGYGPLPVPVVVGHIGKGAQNLVVRCLEEHGHEDRSVEGNTRALRIFESHYAAHLLDETRVYPGIGRLLLDLEASGRPMAVVTNKPEGFSRTILDHLGLGSCFLDVVGGETLPTRKPAPEPLWHAIRSCLAGFGGDPSFDLSSKEPDGPPGTGGQPAVSSVMIGDTWIDAAAARAARVPVILVGWGLGDRTRARDSNPDAWAQTTEELRALLLPAVGGAED